MLGFPDQAIRRYSRQMILPEVGGAGQARISRARVLIVGAGGLGSPVALYLAAAGIGTIEVVDGDRVEVSNLQRQILHDEKSLDAPKVASAQARMEALNPDVRVVARHARLGPENARTIVAGHDVVVEGSDDLATKLLVNDACVALGIPLVAAGILAWEGQLLVVRPGETACYRCVYRGVPVEAMMPTCASAGILGPVAGVVGSLQAVETLKLCLGLPTVLVGRLLLYDGASGELRHVQARRDPACAACAALSVKGRDQR